MISSFFSKTKPISYVVLLVFLGGFYWVVEASKNNFEFTTESFWLQMLVMLVLLASVFVIDDMVKKEKITGQSSFAMLFFVLLMVVFPKTILDNNAILANVFMLLSIKKLLEIKEAKNIKHKVFDAALLICVASLFYKWALLYFIVVFFSLNTYGGKNIKNWIAPLMAVISFLMVATAVLAIFNNVAFLGKQYNFEILGIDHTAIISKLGIKHAVFLLLIVGFAIFDFIKYRKKGGGKLITMRMLLLCFVLVFPILFLEPTRSNPILLAFFPAAVFLGSYMETVQRKRFKEFILIVFIALPFFMFFIESGV